MSTTWAPFVKVDVLCQLDWAMGYLDIWSNRILGLTGLMRLTFELLDCMKQIALPNLGGPHRIS